MENGWVKIHRQLKEKGYYKKSQYVHLWVHILLSANHISKEFMWNNNIIMVREGQFITGRKVLSEETGIPESTIEDILKFLESQQQIKQTKTTKYRLITIINWKDYQSKFLESNNTATTRQQQADTNKNNKKDKNINTPVPSTEIDKPKFTSLGADVLKAFESINPSCKFYYNRPPQRQACDDLIKEYGFEKVVSVIKNTLPRSNAIPYFPTITTPVQLRDKWSTLESAITKKRSENNNKGRGFV